MRRIDALVAAMTGSGGPGAAVGVACRGELIYQGCFGLADVEWRQPVTSDTVFALASLSKPLTATTVVLLARDGLIDLDAAVGDYLPEYAGPGRAALIRHLLTHTSGLPAMRTFYQWCATRGEVLDDLMATLILLRSELNVIIQNNN